MAQHIDDSDWSEVEKINSYALFMGYLSMAVRGVGFLVVLWTTVILLGGFVSMLDKKDFWTLTVITLVQTAGVFDVYLNEKLRYVGKSLLGLLVNVVGMTVSEKWSLDWQIVVVAVLLFLHLLVVTVILFPLAVLYMFGLLITTALSLWRLIERDYGKSDGDANLLPALNVLYSLVLFQGMLFCYSSASRIAGTRMAGEVADNYCFDKETEIAGRASVEEYMRQTRTGCAKNPSFARGRNLVTFALELMKAESTSSEDYVSGARILDKLLALELEGRHTLIRQLVGSASSGGKVMHTLLETIRSTSPHDRDVREHAARIVAHLAGDISLTSFPHGIRCISSLLETTALEQQDEDSAPSAHYILLMERGLVILDKLATEEHNRRVISTDQDLLSMAMAPISSDLLHRIDHVAWADVVAASLQLMCRLVTAPGETGTKLRSQVFNNKDAINNMEKIIKCDQCYENLYILAIKILTRVPADAPSSMSKQSRERFTTLLLTVFTNESRDISIRQMAGDEALAMLSDQSESNATIVFKASDTIVHDLSTMLSDDKKDRVYRICAAEILENLYIRYTKDNDYLIELTETMKDVLPKMLREILFVEWISQEKEKEKAEKETDGVKLSAPETDIEDQNGVASQDNDGVNEQNDYINEDVDRKLYAALLSLSVGIFGKLISDGKDFAQLVDTIAQGDCAFSFSGKLEEFVKGNSKPTAHCLRILKITCRMIISLIKLNGVYVQAELESLMDSLSNASKKMLGMEGLMIFSSTDPMAVKPVSTLSSLVKEAKDLMEKKQALQLIA